MPAGWHPQLKGENDRMRHLALALVLACVLACTARAGEIHTTGAVAPPATTPVTITGEVPATGETASEESSTILAIILTLISIVR